VSDLRPAAQWPDSGARALSIRIVFPVYDETLDAWYWGTPASGYVALEGTDGYVVAGGTGTSVLRATLNVDTVTTY
jgi:hypothetical protein